MTYGSETCNLATVTKAPLSGLGLETVNVPSPLKLWLRKPFQTALDNTHRPAAGPAASLGLGCLGRHGPTSASSITARDQTRVQHSDGGRGRCSTVACGARLPKSVFGRIAPPVYDYFIQLKLYLIIASRAAPLVTPLD